MPSNELFANYGGLISVRNNSLSGDCVYVCIDSGSKEAFIRLSYSEAARLSGNLLRATETLPDLPNLEQAVTVASTLLRNYARGSSKEKFLRAEQALQDHLRALKGEL